MKHYTEAEAKALVGRPVRYLGGSCPQNPGIVPYLTRGIVVRAERYAYHRFRVRKRAEDEWDVVVRWELPWVVVLRRKRPVEHWLTKSEVERSLEILAPKTKAA